MRYSVSPRCRRHRQCRSLRIHENWCRNGRGQARSCVASPVVARRNWSTAANSRPTTAQPPPALRPCLRYPRRAACRRTRWWRTRASRILRTVRSRTAWRKRSQEWFPESCAIPRARHGRNNRQGPERYFLQPLSRPESRARCRPRLKRPSSTGFPQCHRQSRTSDSRNQAGKMTTETRRREADLPTRGSSSRGSSALRAPDRRRHPRSASIAARLTWSAAAFSRCAERQQCSSMSARPDGRGRGAGPRRAPHCRLPPVIPRRPYGWLRTNLLRHRST